MLDIFEITDRTLSELESYGSLATVAGDDNAPWIVAEYGTAPFGWVEARHYMTLTDALEHAEASLEIIRNDGDDVPAPEIWRVRDLPEDRKYEVDGRVLLELRNMAARLEEAWTDFTGVPGANAFVDGDLVHGLTGPSRDLLQAAVDLRVIVADVVRDGLFNNSQGIHN